MAKKKVQATEESQEKAPNPVTRFIAYAQDARNELRKITWPTMQETRKATLSVFGFVAVMAVILWLVDLGLSALIRFVLS